MNMSSRRNSAATSLGRRAALPAPVTFGISLLARLLDAMRQDGLRVRGRPTIRKQRFEFHIIASQLDENIPDVRPWFEVVSLGSGKDRVQNGRPRASVLAAQKLPILAFMQSSA
jgi:hypothetical protein